tara:strand:+ start:220 stop:471 length:252 start_codon:yes stop_codon:yes gene_type:complete
MYPMSGGTGIKMIILEEDMQQYINKYKYLVVFPDKRTELFKSLRDIQNAVSIDSSTISKKLNQGENMFTSKGNDFIFYIKQLN